MAFWYSPDSCFKTKVKNKNKRNQAWLSGTVLTAASLHTTMRIACLAARFFFPMFFSFLAARFFSPCLFPGCKVLFLHVYFFVFFVLFFYLYIIRIACLATRFTFSFFYMCFLTTMRIWLRGLIVLYLLHIVLYLLHIVLYHARFTFFIFVYIVLYHHAHRLLGLALCRP